jgi:predicted ester cyclase
MQSVHGQRDLVTLAEGDYLVQFGKIAATWAGGDFRGHELLAGNYECDVAFMYRFQEGRIAERWAIRDDLAMIEQLNGARSAHPVSSV